MTIHDPRAGRQHAVIDPDLEDAMLLREPPSLRLDGKVAWVTGASRGLGRALAFALAGAGAELLLTARDGAALGEVARKIEASGGSAIVAQGSVDVAENVQAAASLAQDRWGRVDVLINNAGISPSFSRAERVTAADWRAVLDVNLTGAFMCAQQALPLLEAAGGGAIVNVSSVTGSRGHERLLPYSVSKAGLELLTRTLAIEWATKGIRVNSVAPGYFRSDMSVALREHERWGPELLGRIPMGRFGDRSEVVPAVLLLAGPASSYITGTTLFVDGGWMAR
jgi:NAD(P)-dependent dehydrogenase (short-subunit alcohol dehydrogenase family)